MDTDPIGELPPEVKQHLTRYKAPPGLERRVRHLLEQQDVRPRRMERLQAALRHWLPVSVGFACGLLVAVLVFAYHDAGRDAGEFEQQVVSAHVRSLLADHLIDVASSDQHTVKPWFSGKLDFAPPVADLSAAGFPLVGGRLDYLAGRPVAALVYRRHGHVVNLFVAPAPDARATAISWRTGQGYQIASWQEAGMRCWAISDASRDELGAFTAAMQAAR